MMTAKENKYHPQIVFHPGETLAERLEELGMGPKEFAIRAGKPEKTVIAILKGLSSITPEMAVQFEYVLKIPAHFWLNMQRHYDEFIARKKRQELLTESIQWAKKFPYSEMVKKGWLSPHYSAKDKTSELLSYFGFSDHHAWESFYLSRKLKVTFRISLAHTNEAYAISAWLRQGELQAAETVVEAYQEKKFKDMLHQIKIIMAEHPDNFFQLLHKLCAKSGVKVIYTPCIKKAPINGCTRWINGSPVIQLSGRYKRNDIFWFTFFHEAGHILLHGKKDVFLENMVYSDLDTQKELEADNFAIKWTFPKEQEDEVLQHNNITEKKIKDFAKKFNTHPAIIVGRLQHRKYLPFSWGKSFFQPVNLEVEL